MSESEKIQSGADAALSHNYFRQNLLPKTPQITRLTVETTLPYTQHDGVELLLVEGGRGTLYVNGLGYTLMEGSCGLLYFYHFWRAEAVPEAPLRLVSIQMSFSTYLFISASPSYQMIFAETAQHLLLTRFCGNARKRVRQITETLLAEQESSASADEIRTFVLLSELIARLYRETTQGGDMHPKSQSGNLLRREEREREP